VRGYVKDGDCEINGVECANVVRVKGRLPALAGGAGCDAGLGVQHAARDGMEREENAVPVGAWEAADGCGKDGLAARRTTHAGE
jgi:hypothetical protein